MKGWYEIVECEIHRRTWQSDLAKWEGNVERLVGEATRASYLAGRSNESSMALERKRGLDNGALLSGRGIPSEKLLSENSRGTRVRTLESSVDDLRIARCSLLLEINFFSSWLEGGFPSFCFLHPTDEWRLCESRQNSSLMGRLRRNTARSYASPFPSRIYNLVTRDKLFKEKKVPPLQKYHFKTYLE